MPDERGSDELTYARDLLLALLDEVDDSASVLQWLRQTAEADIPRLLGIGSDGEGSHLRRFD